MLPMALANDAVIRDGACIGDPTEGALVVLAAKSGLDVEETRGEKPRVGEVPFDAEYKLMATFHDIEGVVRCFVKGAPDVLLARSTSYLDIDGATKPIGDLRQRVVEENDRLASEGMRVLGGRSARLRQGDVRSVSRPARTRSAISSCSPSSASSTRRARRRRTRSRCARTPASGCA